MFDLIVVGGGLVGLTAAYEAVKLGARVALIDREDAGRASAAGAGILTPGTVSTGADAWWREFAFPAVAYYDALTRDLADDGETDTGYSRCGLLHIASSAEEAEKLDAVVRMIEENQRLDAPALGELSRLDAEQATELFPALAPVAAALHVTGACRVDGRKLMNSLRRAAAKRGLEIFRESAASLKLVGNRVEGVDLAGGETLPTRRVVLAGGAWSGAFARQLKLSLPVAPQRGQILHLQFPTRETRDWPVVMGFHSHYMVTFPEGRVVVGATRENGSGFDVRPTAAGIHEVLGEALRVAPGLADATLNEIRVGLRPASVDGLPVLGPVPGAHGVHLASGHGPSGLQLGPYSGRVVARVALGEQDPAALERFAVSRFETPTA